MINKKVILFSNKEAQNENKYEKEDIPVVLRFHQEAKKI